METVALIIQIYFYALLVSWFIMLYYMYIKGNKPSDYNTFENIFYSFVCSLVWPYLVFLFLKEKVFNKTVQAEAAQRRLIRQAESRAKQHSKETDKAIEFRKKNNPTIDDEVEKMRKEIYK